MRSSCYMKFIKSGYNTKEMRDIYSVRKNTGIFKILRQNYTIII
jgi:hypothetical protein